MRGGEDARGARRGAAWRSRVAGRVRQCALDSLGGMRGVARCAAQLFVGKTTEASVKLPYKPVKAGARAVQVLGYICSEMVKVGSCP